MRKRATLISGAAGEIGNALIHALAKSGDVSILTIDLRPLEPDIAALVDRQVTASIVDRQAINSLLAEFEIDLIVHLAALLSTRSEFTPYAAHQVNVEGTLNLLEFAHAQGSSHGRPVTFLYPSSIAAYGMPDLATKAEAGKVSENDYTVPITMYGCNKLYCEHLGRYYSHFYRQLDVERQVCRLDFRCLRFPGLISAETVPSGGTSDYAPEMLHAAASGKSYRCFVRPDTRIPFMAMPDAIDALLRLAHADADALTRSVYNIAAFNPSAGEIREIVVKSFPTAEITFEPDDRRQPIVDSWPADVDDSAARKDWGFAPKYDLQSAFADYLIPRITA